MSSSIKISQLSSIDTLVLSSIYIVALDEIDTTQGVDGSTKKVLGSDLALEFWSMSGDYITSSDLTFIAANSAHWQSSYTTVNGNSATTWNYQGNDLKALSAAWQSAYNSVNTNSAVTWNYQGNDVKSLTSNWEATRTGFANQSANNTNVYNSVNSNSSNWNNTYNTVNTSSGTWGGGGGSPTFLSGGTTNQILVKTSATDYATAWRNKRITLTLSNLSATGTISSNALSADQFVVTVSGGPTLSATIGAPSNPFDAQIIMFNIRYGSNIARTSLATEFRSPLTTLNWSNSANRMDIVTVKYNLLDSKWDVVGFSPGYLL